MFNCTLCRSQCQEYVYLSSHCTECEEIRRIISLYNRTDILNTLRLVYLRDEPEKRNNRTIREADKIDENENKIVTRSSKSLKEK